MTKRTLLFTTVFFAFSKPVLFEVAGADEYWFPVAPVSTEGARFSYG